MKPHSSGPQFFGTRDQLLGRQFFGQPGWDEGKPETELSMGRGMGDRRLAQAVM